MTKPSSDDYQRAILDALVPQGPAAAAMAVGAATPARPDEPDLPDEDEVWLEVRELLSIGTTGIILRGIPGTSKTWYARKLAKKLVGNPAADIFRVQFHPSYGYEDFVEGYKPDPEAAAGFEVIKKVFLKACDRAGDTETPVVFIIDEVNRGDPARVFGELLTYIERSYRGESFYLPYSGEPTSIPANLLILGTMNPYDRSIAQLDAAFVRRFDHLTLEPDAELVGTFLESTNQFTPTQVDRVRNWFEALQRLVPNGVGHTYFKDVRRPEDLQLIWQFRIWPVCEAALEFDPRNQENIKASFDSMYGDVIGQAPAPDQGGT